jgi:hypothetical protein
MTLSSQACRLGRRLTASAPIAIQRVKPVPIATITRPGAMAMADACAPPDGDSWGLARRTNADALRALGEAGEMNPSTPARRYSTLTHRVVVRQSTARLASHKPPATAVRISAQVTSLGCFGITSGIGWMA